MSTFLQQMSQLSSAEDFFEALEVPFDPQTVRVNRLHILKRLHDYVSKEDLASLSEEAQRALYQEKLMQAHQDFVTSDAVTERVFKVFKQVKGQAFVGLGQIEPLGKTS